MSSHVHNSRPEARPHRGWWNERGAAWLMVRFPARCQLHQTALAAGLMLAGSPLLAQAQTNAPPAPLPGATTSIRPYVAGPGNGFLREAQRPRAAPPGLLAEPQPLPRGYRPQYQVPPPQQIMPLPPGSGGQPGLAPGGMPPAGLPPTGPGTWFDRRPSGRLRDYSWIYIDTPEPPEIKVHDIVTIVVNEKARFDANTQFNRTRNATLTAELKEFIRLGENGNLNTAASNEPTIDGKLTGRLQSNGQTVDSEGANYRIAATVVDILPNGYLVLEARKSMRSNRDMYEYTLTGILRPDDISPRNEAYSEDIASLQISRKSRGKAYSSTKRPWGLRLYDLLFPF